MANQIEKKAPKGVSKCGQRRVSGGLGGVKEGSCHDMAGGEGNAQVRVAV